MIRLALNDGPEFALQDQKPLHSKTNDADNDLHHQSKRVQGMVASKS